MTEILVYLNQVDAQITDLNNRYFNRNQLNTTTRLKIKRRRIRQRTT